MLSASNKRLQNFVRILYGAKPETLELINLRTYVTSDSVAIGEVVKTVQQPESPEYVPRMYCKCFFVVINFNS